MNYPVDVEKTDNEHLDEVARFLKKQRTKLVERNKKETTDMINQRKQTELRKLKALTKGSNPTNKTRDSIDALKKKWDGGYLN